MSDYKIVGLNANNIALEFDGKRINFPLPIVDGLYPEGAALTELLDHYVATARSSAANAQQVVIATNDAVIRALIVPPTATEQQVLIKTNQLLRLTDWTQLLDAGLTTEEQAAWTSYRAALRAIPTQVGFPTTITWPIPPAPITNPTGITVTNSDGSPVGL